MSLRIIAPGVHSTLQGSRRTGHRHLGVPWSGPADALSHALANRLVGNPLDGLAVEIPWGNFAAQVDASVYVSVTGAPATVFVNGELTPQHQTLALKQGDALNIGPAEAGLNIYLAISGEFCGADVLGSPSTYTLARIGGMEGRALQRGDHLERKHNDVPEHPLETPPEFRPQMTNHTRLRVTASAETALLSRSDQERLFGAAFEVSRQASRMAVPLTGERLNPPSGGIMESGAVFPGTIQCPEDGHPIILLADAQTTGGYPRIASVIRCDRHMLGQLRPGATVGLQRTCPEDAVADADRKITFLREWLEGIDLS